MSGLLALSPTTLIVLNQPPHQVILCCQQLLQADCRVRWWRWGIITWNLAMPTSNRPLKDVEDRVLGSPCMHHLSYCA
jgi:hypothetical protein